MTIMLKLFLLAVIVGIVTSQNSYIIVAPSSIRPGMDYEISAHVLKAPTDVNFTASLGAYGTDYSTVKEVLVQGQPKRISLKVPDRLIADYTLEVTGSGGLTFSGWANIKYRAKNKSIFIQTDKAIYKPGQTVHFRVFAMHPNMKIYTGAYNIDIYDSKLNKIKQWMNATDPLGVITNFLPMSTQPVLGNWKINVTVDDAAVEKTFAIAEYVLPKFEVTVELPSYAATKDTHITATVKAQYTYGKPVNGTVELVAKMNNSYEPWMVNYYRNVPMVHKTFTIDGESKVIIPLTEMQPFFLKGNPNTKIQVEANVTEALTGITLTGSNKVEMFTSTCKLSIVNADATFKPGMVYTTHLLVQQPDGRPVPLLPEPVVVATRVTSEIKPVGTTPAYFYPRANYYNLPERKFPVPVSGIVPIKILTPSNATSIGLRTGNNVNFNVKANEPVIELFYLDAGFSGDTEFRSMATKGTFGIISCQQLLSAMLIGIDLSATTVVISRGNIVATRSIDGKSQEAFNFSIPVTATMAPTARIIVYYLRKDGEIVPDDVSFDVDGAFENQVSISMDKTSAQPGESVNIQVTADPQSLVNLLAVDQSVLLLKSSNDITQSEVLNELQSYNSLGGQGGSNLPYGFHGGPLPIWAQDRGGNDAVHTFQNAGTVVVTDAYLYRYVRPIIFPYPTPRPVGHLPVTGSGSGTNGGQQLKEVEKIRSNFPETWLWMNKTVGSDGKVIISTSVPDTITSWVANAFAVNNRTGLGIAPTMSKIRVFRPFFVSLNLPYSVTRGEQVALQAIVFNYLTQDVDAVVSLPQSHEYQNVIIDSTGHEQTDSKDIMQTVHVKAGDATSVFFPVIPTTQGKIDFTVSARSTLAADAVRRQLFVEPEGTPKEYSIPVLIDLNNVTTFSAQANITLPKNVVAGSLRTTVTAIGDLIGPSVSSLNNLLRMPTGCGEQTMVTFAPDVFITKYLTATNQLTDNIERLAINLMETGYQRELTYQHKDGSFSAFGDRDTSGSMWLTAFVVKSFHQAKSYIFIDDAVLTKGISWMLARQSNDGQFPEPGVVHDMYMTGGAGKGDTLTAFVLIALLENSDLTGEIQSTMRQAISKTVKYLESHTPADVYSLAIVTYALQLAGSSTADTYFATLNSQAINQGGFKHWHNLHFTMPDSEQWWKSEYTVDANDVVTTSYALLTYMDNKKNDISGGLGMMKWIASQRNSYGGFSSTQDTIVGLQALSVMHISPSSDLQVNISAAGFNHTFSVNDNNALVLQSVELPPGPHSVQVDATGSGSALVQIGVFFNVDDEVERPSFNLTWNILEEDVNSITLHTCASWLGPNTSGMAIQEVGLPSGFEVDRDTITEMQILKRIETPNKKVVLYFDKIGSTPVCVTLNLKRTGLVAKSQPAPIRVYDYYEPINQKTVFYESTILKNSTICSVCADCENCSVKSGI